MNRVVKVTIYALGILSTVAVGAKEVSRTFAPKVPTSADEARQIRSQKDTHIAYNR